MSKPAGHEPKSWAVYTEEPAPGGAGAAVSPEARREGLVQKLLAASGNPELQVRWHAVACWSQSLG
jgi:hypothetical protein